MNNILQDHFILNTKAPFSDNHWGNKKKVIKKNKYLNQIILNLFINLTKKLNKIHNKKNNLKYWRTILFPWIGYYVYTIYDRWEIISLLKKKKKKFKVIEYPFSLNNIEVESTEDWVTKSQDKIFNNRLFIDIIKFRKLNVKLLKKNISLKYNEKPNTLKKINFKKIIDTFLSKFALKKNTIYFDLKIPFKELIYISLKLFQIPTRNSNIFNNFIKAKKNNYEKRKLIFFNNNFNSQFEKFLSFKLKTLLPRSILEDYNDFINFYKSEIKKKKLFVSAYEITMFDYFKIFLAEAKKNKSKFIHIFHGPGLYSRKLKDLLINESFFNKVSDYKIVPSKNLVKRKQDLYFGLDIFEKKKKYQNRNKLLINYQDGSKYLIKIPLTHPIYSESIKILTNTLISLKRLNKNIKSVLRFRAKESLKINGISESYKIFLNFFNKRHIETIDSKSYSQSINESKLVICFISQTSYTECIHKNIPTILIGNHYNFFDNKFEEKLKKKMIINNMYFDNIEKAVKFINLNWNNIFNWWNSKDVQKVRNRFLELNYTTEKKCKSNFVNFIKNQIKINHNVYLKNF